MGRGIIHEPDDIRPDNLAVHPELLAYLENQLVKTDYDLKHIYSLILNSSTYQQSSRVAGILPAIRGRDALDTAEALFACYPVRRLEAEVLIDALCWISGTQESYSSPIPEPFTFIPGENRSIELAAAQEYFQTKGINLKQATNDLAWALINTKEFLYRH